MKLYREDISPLVDEFTTRNRAAADRAMVTLWQDIQAHRSGIPAFTEDLTSWRTRFGVIGKETSDLWHKWRHREPDANHVQEYVSDKFRRNVLSEESLRNDVAAAISQFRTEVRANQNRLYSELRPPLDRIKSRLDVDDAAFAQFQRDMQTSVDQMTRGLGGDSATTGVVIFVGSTLAASVTQRLVTQIVTQVLEPAGTALAVEGIEAGGSTAAGVAIGGGVGTSVGPEGTIVGVGGGLIVCLVVDRFLNKQFEAKVNDQCVRFLDVLQRQLVDGDGSGKNAGLQRTLLNTVTRLDEIQRAAVIRALREEHK